MRGGASSCTVSASVGAVRRSGKKRGYHGNQTSHSGQASEVMSNHENRTGKFKCRRCGQNTAIMNVGWKFIFDHPVKQSRLVPWITVHRKVMNIVRVKRGYLFIHWNRRWLVCAIISKWTNTEYWHGRTNKSTLCEGLWCPETENKVKENKNKLNFVQ